MSEFKESKAEIADRILAGLRYLGKKELRPYSHQEIGEICGVDGMTIHRIEKQALKKLQFLIKDGIS